MTQPEDDIAFLEDFRDRIMRFLIAGSAPSRDPLWGGNGIFEMDKAMQDPAFRQLRQDIDRMKGRAARILERLDIGCTFNQYPPPAAGGPVIRYPLFDLITDNRSPHTLDGGVFTAKIDDAIGRLHYEAELRVTNFATATAGAMPVFPVGDLDAALEFYETRLGFTCASRGSDHAFVLRGPAGLLLRRDPDGEPSGQTGSTGKAILFVDDPGDLASQFRKGDETGAGFEIATEYGMRGFTVTDPDGNLLFCGCMV